MTTIDEMRALPHDEMVTEVVKGLIDVMKQSQALHERFIELKAFAEEMGIAT
jgi:hypothetical protein